jgi:iron complex outermembrane receptor protein
MSRPTLRTLLLGSAIVALPLPVVAQTATATTQSMPTGSVTLPDIQVRDRADGIAIDQTTAGPVRGYQALTAQSGTRVQGPIQSLPFSIQVIPRQVIEEQGSTSQTDVLRNAASVTPVTPLFPGQVGPKIRGFQAERFIDGLPVYYDPGSRDLLAGIERIEVLKGPPSILMQGGLTPTGGVVNILSKLPTNRASYELGITGGMYGMWSPYFDLNQPLTPDGSVLFRVTGQYESTHSNIDILQRRSYEFNPSLTFTNNRDTSLTIQGRISHRDQQDYSGLPVSGSLDTSLYTVRRTLFPSSRYIPRASSDIASLTARLDHRFNDTWSTFTIARVSTARYREPSQFTFGNAPAIPPSTSAVLNGQLNEDTSEVSINSNVVAKFDAGPTQNTILFGIDYNRVTDKGFLNADLAGLVDFSNPVFPDWVTPPSGPFTSFSNIDNNYQNLGVTLQAQSTLWQRLHVLGGLRLANVNINSRELITASSYNTNETRLLPRIGVGYDLLPGLTVFANYSQGLRPVPFFNGPTAPKPESSEQVEVGLKMDFGFGLSGSMALFDITRQNVVTPSTTVPGQQVQTGQQRSQGFDADLIWQPSPHWSFLASFIWMDPRVTKDNTPVVGNVLAMVPRASGRLWGAYRFTDGPMEGLTLGAGLYTASAQALNQANSAFTPGYVTFDARAAYTWRNYTVAVVGRNLANRQYYLPYPYLDGRVMPAEGRTIYASLSAKF